jgi:hypothetical protein
MCLALRKMQILLAPKKTKLSYVFASLLLTTICFINLSCGYFAGSTSSKNIAPKTYVYAGTNGGGVSISQDNGLSWVERLC